MQDDKKVKMVRTYKIEKKMVPKVNKVLRILIRIRSVLIIKILDPDPEPSPDSFSANTVLLDPESMINPDPRHLIK